VAGLPPGTGRAPLELDAAELIERHAAGESISQIARDLKVSRATVRKRLSP
jgi:DNA invertase Pin-like site-specific DNA recombinase